MTTPHFIPDHGGYEDLLSFQKARIVYDGTYRFCERFLKRGDRTIDQMLPLVRASKTFWKAAKPAAPRRRWRLNWSMSREQVWRSYWKIIATNCEPGGISNGKRIPKRRCLSESWDQRRIRLMGPIRPILIASPLMLLLTS